MPLYFSDPFGSSDEDPYWDEHFYKAEALETFPKPLADKKWRERILKTMTSYRDKLLRFEFKKKWSSNVSLAKEVLNDAIRLEGKVTDLYTFGFYNEAQLGDDIFNGLRVAIRAIEEATYYSIPPRRINLDTADPKLVKEYARNWLVEKGGFGHEVENMSREEHKKHARAWIKDKIELAKSPKQNVIERELIQDLIKIWEEAMLPAKGTVNAWDFCHRKQDPKDGKYHHGGEFLDFIWAVLVLFKELPQTKSAALEEEEKVRLQKQAIYQRIKTAISTKKH